MNVELDYLASVEITTTMNSTLMKYQRKEHLDNNEPISPETGRDTYPCTTCGVTFPSRISLRKHLMMGHTTAETANKKAHLCGICGRTFSTTGYLKLHERKGHADEMPTNKETCDETFKCATCYNSYSSKCNLLRHLRTGHINNTSTIKNVEGNQSQHVCSRCGSSYSSKRNLTRHLKLAHNVVISDEPFLCSTCGKSFSSTSNLGRHRRKAHNAEIITYKDASNKPHKCSTCGRGYSAKSNLTRHMRIAHKIQSAANNKLQHLCTLCGKGFVFKNNMKMHQKKIHNIQLWPSKDSDTKTSYPCPICKKSFTLLSNMKVHLKTLHNNQNDSNAKTLYPCSICGKSFSFLSNMKMHKKTIHNYQDDSVKTIYTCAICGETYTTKLDLRRHIRSHDDSRRMRRVFGGYNKKEVNCVLCDATTMGHSEMRVHYSMEHDKEMSYLSFDFANEKLFLQWKDNIEKEIRCSFIRSYSSQGQNHKDTQVVFRCSRSGYFQNNGTGKRRSRYIGSKKINGYCPAQIKAVFTNTQISVKYLPTHVGHDDSNKPCYMNLSDSTRDQIVAQLRKGVPASMIVKNMKYPLPVATEKVERVHLLTLRDVVNIGRKFGVYHNERLGRQDRVSVDEWVESNKSSVLYYKASDSRDERFPCLSNDDLVLVFMTARQKEALVKFGGKLVTVDSTQGSDVEAFSLTTVTVLDETNRGYPVAFMFSTEVDDPTLTVFFELLKSAVGALSVRTLMTNTEEVFWNAWTSVFPEPEYHLFCKWHVLRAWRDRLNGVSSQDIPLETKKQVYRFLRCNLLQETDEEVFLEELNKFLRPHRVIETFQEFFQTYYEPRVFQWAHCFWKQAGVDVGMVLESFHKVLKYGSLNGKNIRKLETALRGLMRYLYKKFESDVIDDENVIVGDKRRVIQTRHKKSLKGSIDTITKLGESWVVESFGKTETPPASEEEKEAKVREVHFVQQVEKTCGVAGPCKLLCTACNECAHQYKCSCVDFSVLNNMCKHIHLLSRYRSAQAANEERCCSNNEEVAAMLCEEEEEETTVEYEIATYEVECEPEPQVIEYEIASYEEGDLIELPTEQEEEAAEEFIVQKRKQQLVEQFTSAIKEMKTEKNLRLAEQLVKKLF